MTKNTPIFWHDATNYQKRLSEIHDEQTKLQRVLNEFLALDLPIKVKTISDLQDLINEGEEFVKDAIARTLEPKTFGPFKMRPRAMVDTLELPSMSLLTESINNVGGAKRLRFLHHLKLEGDAVVFPEAQKKLVEEAYTMTAQDDEEVAAINALKQLADAVGALSKIFYLGPETELNRLLLYSKVDGKYVVKPWTEFFKTRASDLYKYRNPA